MLRCWSLLVFAATDIGCYGEGNACFPASTSPLPLHAGFVFWSPASSGRVKAVAIRRCSGADLVPYLPCAVCTASSTGYRSQDSLFSAPCPFPRREDTVQYLRTPYDAAASCFNNAPTAIQILENTPQARDMATGYGDQSSSSQLFPLFGKLRFSQKTKDKFQKASQGPIGYSVGVLKRSSLLCAVDVTVAESVRKVINAQVAHASSQFPNHPSRQLSHGFSNRPLDKFIPWQDDDKNRNSISPRQEIKAFLSLLS